MSKSVNSPTARLLQSSRLFSLPRPLPQNAPSNASANGSVRGSDTATKLYPTHQAIVTPASSLHRGDWGLKRALPSKATKNTSTPVIRIKAGDNWEHITSFESAADHERTLAKWNELGVPMMQRKPRERMSDTSAYERQLEESVFEDNFDNTNPAVTDDITGDKTRWKYKGPWLAGMLQGDFDIWVNKSVGRRSAEWRQFLRQNLASERQREARQIARDEGNAATTTSDSLPDISDAELADYEKRLRDSHVHDNLASELTRLITRFLDLPALTTTNASESSNYARTSGMRSILRTMQADEGPPTTHPSAGLSHLRTSAHMTNHPVHGPQALSTPVPARVLRPREMRGAPDTEAKLGVAGFVTKDPTKTIIPKGQQLHKNPRFTEADRLVQYLDPEREGGNVIQVHPRHAEVDENGRVILSIERGDKEAIAVKSGEVDWIHEQRARGGMGGGAGNGGFAGSRSVAPPGTAGNANFGSALPDRRRMAGGRFAGERGAGRVRGFDEEEGGQGRQQGGGRQAMERISRLMREEGGGGPGQQGQGREKR